MCLEQQFECVSLIVGYAYYDDNDATSKTKLQVVKMPNGEIIICQPKKREREI